MLSTKHRQVRTPYSNEKENIDGIEPKLLAGKRNQLGDYNRKNHKKLANPAGSAE